MITPELEKILKENGYIHLKEIEGRGICGLNRFLFTIGLVYGLDYAGYKGRWCYSSMVEAALAIETWDGKGDPPYNWIKYKGKDGERSRIPQLDEPNP